MSHLLHVIRCFVTGHRFAYSRRFPGMVTCQKCGARRSEH